jgi:WD40 repeat protein
LRFGPGDRLAAGLDESEAVLWEVTVPREYRTLRRLLSYPGEDAYHCCALSPEGRWLAVGGDQGADVWDLDAGRLRGTVPAQRCFDVAFEAPGVLLTVSNLGKNVHRWRIGDDLFAALAAAKDRPESAAEPVTYSLVNPPPPVKRPIRRLAAATPFIRAVAVSREGGVIVLASGQRLNALHRGPPGRAVVAGPHAEASHVAVSPDGRLAATASDRGTQVKVWDTDSGALVKELPADEPCRVGFSADGRWLLTTAGGCRLWETATWQPGPVHGGTAFAFAADQPRLLALEAGTGVIRLLDPATGHEYVRLEDPDRDAAAQLCLSADGSRLVSMSEHTRSVHVWDLRSIRRRLDESGLAGDWPPGR